MKRSRITMNVDQLRDVCAYAHWMPILNGLHLEFFAQNYPGWEWNDFVPKLWKKGIIVSDVRDSDFIRLSQGLFVAPDVESIDFIPGDRGIRVVVHYVKEGNLMGNVANIQCPICRGHDIDRKWVLANSYFQCNTCGERWK